MEDSEKIEQGLNSEYVLRFKAQNATNIAEWQNKQQEKADVYLIGLNLACSEDGDPEGTGNGIAERGNYNPKAEVRLNDPRGEVALFALALEGNDNVVWIEGKDDIDFG